MTASKPGGGAFSGSRRAASIALVLMGSALVSGCITLNLNNSAPTVQPNDARPAGDAPADQPTSSPGAGTPVSARPAEAATTPVPADYFSGIDWIQVVKDDPGLVDDPEAPPIVGLEKATWVATADGTVAGYLMGEPPILFDLDGDGREEAIFPLYSGGTAGDTGLLVFTAGAPGTPRFLTSRSGYKMYARVEDGRFVIGQPVYGPWEPNCCPGGIETSSLRLSGADWIVDSSVVSGVLSARPAAVERFYLLLGEAVAGNRSFDDAYAILSPAFQNEHPFKDWVDGYANTISVEAEISYANANSPGPIGVSLTAGDKGATAGNEATRRYEGSWSLIYDIESGFWRLDRGVIQEAE